MMKSKFKIEVKIDGNWRDVTQYVTPDWGTEVLIGESGCQNYEASNLTFHIVDRDLTPSVRYWFSQMASADTIPEVRVKSVYGDTEPPLTRTIFYGYVNPGCYTWEGDCITSFTAIPILSQGDRMDMLDVVKSSHPDGRYSGLAEDLTVSALRALGCQGGSQPDVIIQDFPNFGTGTPQQDSMDWNHSLREWHPSPAAELVGDFVPKPDIAIGSSDMLGWTVRYGKIFSVHMDERDGITLQEIPHGIANGVPVRIFPFHLGNASPTRWGLCVVFARKRAVYVGTPEIWQGWQAIDTFLAAGGLVASMALGNPLVSAGVMMLGEVGKGLTRKYRWEKSNRQEWQICGLLIYGIQPDGLLQQVRYYAGSPFAPSTVGYCPAFTVCYARQNTKGTAQGEIFFTRWYEVTQYWALYRAYYDTASGSVKTEGLGISLRFLDENDQKTGRPIGGMATRQRVFLVQCEGGLVVVAAWTSNGVQLVKGRVCYGVQNSPRQYIGALVNSEGGNYYVYFLVPDSKKAIKQRVPLTSDEFLPPYELVDVTLDNSTDWDGEIVNSRFCDNVGQPAENWAGVIYTQRSGNRYNYFAGVAKTIFGNSGVNIVSDYSRYPLPQGDEGTWNPPMVFRDAAQNNFIRMVVPCARLNGETWIDDWYLSSLYAVPRIHWDFAQNRMTVAEFLKYVAQSFWCYLRVLDPSPVNSASGIRVVSRHYWTPTLTGTLDKDSIEMQPKMVGVEYYDGAYSSLGSVEIRQGSVAIGKTVFPLSSPFLTPAWARNICSQIVALYPRKSGNYPFGRRVFRLNALWIVDEGNVKKPVGYEDVYRLVQISPVSGVQIYAIITSVGFRRADLTSPVTCLEYCIHPVSGKGDGVFWAVNCPDASPDWDAFNADEPSGILEMGGIELAGAQVFPSIRCEMLSTEVAPLTISTSTQGASVGLVHCDSVNHPGVLRLTLNAGRSFAAVRTCEYAFLLGGGEKYTVIFRVPAGNPIQPGIFCRGGFLREWSFGNPVGDAVYFEFSPIDNYLNCKVRVNGIEHNTITGYTISPETWYRMMILVNTDRADFYLCDENNLLLWSDWIDQPPPITSLGAGLILSNAELVLPFPAKIDADYLAVDIDRILKR